MKKLQLVVLDLETFWSTEHTLSKMSPIEYCMHPETEIISLAVKFGTGPVQCGFGEERIKKAVARADWSDKLVVGHNLSGFDAMILSWRLGIKPAMWGCTLAMSRPLHALDVGGSLAKLVAHYNLGVKDQTALMNTKGRHLKDFSADEIAAMKQYNMADVEQCYELFKILLRSTSSTEMKLIDMTIRTLIEPQMEVDVPLLEKTLQEEQESKLMTLVEIAELLKVETPEEARVQLASGPKFKALLETLGAECPMKQSPTNAAKMTPALAKTDQAFLDLQEHENPIVAAAAAARLGVKSTLLETRIQKFLQAASYCGGKLPVPLRYYGAHTGRWSGEQYNPQNLPRIGPKAKRSDALRNCMRAPAGHKIVVADQSGIELRVNHFLWKVPSSMEMYKASPDKADLYKHFASELYEIEQDAVSKEQRQVGKVAHLGLGFGAGATTFQTVAKIMGGVALTEGESQDVVDKWRGAYSEITQGWKECHAALNKIAKGYWDIEIDPWGMCRTVQGGIKTPRGMIRYPDLRQERDENGKTEWVYGQGRNKTRIYAGRITENIVQHLARCTIADNALEIKKVTGYNPCLLVHDELVYVVPEDDAEEHLKTIQGIMRTPPKWWPELITWSAGDAADTYGAAK